MFLLSGSWNALAQESNEADSGPPVVLNAQPISPSPPQDLPGHDTGERTTRETADDARLDRVDREWFGGDPWWTWSHATGNWGGARTQLEEAGIFFEGSETLEWTDIWSGGVHGTSSHRRLLDINLTLDLELLFGVSGGSIFADFYSTTGQSASADAGDIQAFSNIETGFSVDELAELWYEQWFFDDHVRLKVGKVDTNSEFAFVDAAGEFINSSAGFSPSIFVLPTYPDGAMSVNAFLYPNDTLYMGIGLYDGAAGVDGVPTGSRGPKTFFNDDLSDDYFLIAEVGSTWEIKDHGPGRAAIGGWYHTGDFARFDGGTEDGTAGVFVVTEQQVWQRNASADAEQGLYAFIQYGFANEEVSAIQHHIAGGLYLSGTFPGREHDGAGIYISHVVLSNEPAAGFVADETAVEFFYKIGLTPSVSIKPNVHFIVNPPGGGTISDAVVGTLRVEFTF